MQWYEYILKVLTEYFIIIDSNYEILHVRFEISCIAYVQKLFFRLLFRIIT